MTQSLLLAGSLLLKPGSSRRLIAGSQLFRGSGFRAVSDNSVHRWYSVTLPSVLFLVPAGPVTRRDFESIG